MSVPAPALCSLIPLPWKLFPWKSRPACERLLASRLEEALTALGHSASSQSSQTLSDHLALFAQWFYRPTARSSGEIVFAGVDGEVARKASAARHLPRRRAGQQRKPRRAGQAPDPMARLRVEKTPATLGARRGVIVVELVPSILSADFSKLALEIEAAERGGGSVIHIDIMDGHFVPNLTMGPPVVKSLRKVTSLPLDCHLMIENPDDFIPEFAEAGANWISVHYEACRHLHRTLELIGQHGMEPAVVINPATLAGLLVDILPMVHHVLVMSVNPGFGGQKFIGFSLDKIRRLVELRAELDLNFRIEVDGGIAHDTIASVVEAGADLLVAGSAVFDSGHPEKEARALLKHSAGGRTAPPGPKIAFRACRGHIIN